MAHVNPVLERLDREIDALCAEADTLPPGIVRDRIVTRIGHVTVAYTL